MLDAGHESARFELVNGGKNREGYGEQLVWLEAGDYGIPLGFANIKFQSQIKTCRFPFPYFDLLKLDLPLFELSPAIDRELQVIEGVDGGLQFAPIDPDGIAFE